MKLYFFVGAVIFGLILTFCAEDEKAKKQEGVQTEQGQIEKSEQTQKVKAFKAEKLKAFLPNDVPQTVKRPVKRGVLREENVNAQTTSREYVFKNKGYLNFQITDYGAKEFIPDYLIKPLENLPKISGKTTEEVVIPHGKGISIWDEQTGSGSFSAVVAGRYFLKIDGRNLPDHVRDIKNYIQYFDLEGLATLSEKE